MEVSGQLHAPAALPPCSLDRRLGGPQRRPGRGGEEKSSITAPAGNWTPVVQLVDCL
jgi:hypothetical protein